MDNQEFLTNEADKELEETINKEFNKVQYDGILIGAQAICEVLLNKIYKFESEQGKKTTNDYKRCLKDLKNFCLTGVSKKFKEVKHNESE